MSDAAQDYWDRRRDELSIRPKGADEIDTRFRRELEALAHQIAEFCHPYEDPLVSVAYAIARTLDLPNWPAAHAELDERDDAAIAAASVVKSLRLATEAAPMSAEPSSHQIVMMAGAILNQAKGTAESRHPYWSEAVKQAEAAYAALQSTAPASPTTVQAAVPMEWDEWRKQLAVRVDDYIQADHDGEGDDEAYADLKAHILKTPFAAPASGGEAPAEGVLTIEDAELLQKAVDDFEDSGETDVPDAALQRFAAMGFLECTHYNVMPAAHEAIDAAMAAKSQKGAA